ncbi:hypothetical protein BGHDH14_bgh01995 [Blumeria hordei DH14]|uniref:Uncharacterized protein n=1 Tax=Blumeria graminis f. sp. hordei (strain DH14) TaxID=546991 RepID=N1JJY2_BLUG1|nr:hypothetical protein BGHDH14_bgh01995 [Blumeria hordei DH14]
MSATIAMAPSPAPHDRSSYADTTHASPSAHVKTNSTARISSASKPNHIGSRTGSTSPATIPRKHSSKDSPILSRQEVKSQVVVKEEPTSSPDLRHRPRKLDLSTNTPTIVANPPGDAANPMLTSRPLIGPLTGRMDGLGIQEVGLACLSPGFNTQDPTMRDHLQRSLSVREQQRNLIEARMNKQSAKAENVAATAESTKERAETGTANTGRAPGTSKRKAPPGLSIVTPSHEEFAQERVIQSAPLNQTFTTGRYQPLPLTRHVTNQPSNLSNTSHIHAHARSSTQSSNSTSIQHAPAIQTSNRLPPIMDIFAAENLTIRDGSNQRSSAISTNGSTSNSSHSNSRPPFPSPNQAAPQPPQSTRPREPRSAEEAQVELSGGRPELLPRLLHYGGHQPPTPPSPRSNKNSRASDANRGGTTRRRMRGEYEEGESPPLGNGPSTSRRSGPFNNGRESPMSTQMKREQFIKLCAEAWDLFHS